MQIVLRIERFTSFGHSARGFCCCLSALALIKKLYTAIHSGTHRSFGSKTPHMRNTEPASCSDARTHLLVTILYSHIAFVVVWVSCVCLPFFFFSHVVSFNQSAPAAYLLAPNPNAGVKAAISFSFLPSSPSLLS